MFPVKQKPAFNKEWAKKVSKDTFIKVHEKAFPDTDLSAAYDEIVPPSGKKAITQKDSKTEEQHD